jgi:hypothetical protein
MRSFLPLLAALAPTLVVLGCSAPVGSIDTPNVEGPVDPTDPTDPTNPPVPGRDAGGDATPGTDARPPTDGSPGTDTSTPPPDSTPPAPTEELVKGLSISEIAVFQGVKVSIAKAGAKFDPSAKVHVVTGKSALMRVYVQPGDGFTPREVIGELELRSGSAAPKVLRTTKTVSAGSSEATLDSSINFKIPEGAIAKDTSYVVRLLTKPGQPSSGTSTDARFPRDGAPTTLDAFDTGEGSLKVVLVPIKYTGDGSGRTAPFDDAQLKIYRDQLHAMYPARKVELTVREPFAWSTTLSRGGSGIGSLLDGVTKLRRSDAAPDDVYYYGAFTVTSTFSEYCGSGCTTGLCHLVNSSSDSLYRACVGIGYAGKTSAGTMAHELGHAHGLPHAPCGGVSGADPSFPYSGGQLGSWGYDERTDTMVEPTKGRDFMSYCSPEWISDYNFERLIKRVSAVSKAGADVSTMSLALPTTYRFVEVQTDGTLRLGDEITLKERLYGEPHEVTYTDDAGHVVMKATGYFTAYDEIEGGTLLVPSPRPEIATLQIHDLPARVQNHLVLRR